MKTKVLAEFEIYISVSLRQEPFQNFYDLLKTNYSTWVDSVTV